MPYFKPYDSCLNIFKEFFFIKMNNNNKEIISAYNFVLFFFLQNFGQTPYKLLFYSNTNIILKKKQLEKYLSPNKPWVASFPT